MDRSTQLPSGRIVQKAEDLTASPELSVKRFRIIYRQVLLLYFLFILLK